MAATYHKIETNTVIDEDGNSTSTKKETCTKIERIDEPDYIKLYTKVWCEFNGIPLSVRPLFLELVSRMSYCNSKDLKNSQLVYVIEPTSSHIAERLGIKKNMLSKQLKTLCECKAIRSISRGVYQINPDYAGKGEWKYNPNLDRGGVKDLIATFNFADKKVDTKIIWADNGKDSEMNSMYRTGLNVAADDKAILTNTIISSIEQELPTC